MRQVPSVARLALVATVCYGFVCLVFVTAVLWISVTTNEPVILNPHAFGEAEMEAVGLAIVTGVSCYGMAVFDWLYRNPQEE